MARRIWPYLPFMQYSFRAIPSDQLLMGGLFLLDIHNLSVLANDSRKKEGGTRREFRYSARRPSLPRKHYLLLLYRCRRIFASRTPRTEPRGACMIIFTQKHHSPTSLLFLESRILNPPRNKRNCSTGRGLLLWGAPAFFPYVPPLCS